MTLRRRACGSSKGAIILVCGLMLGVGGALAQEAKTSTPVVPATAKGAAVNDAKIEAVQADQEDEEDALTNAVVETSSARVVGLRIQNVSVEPRDDKTATVTFDVSWTNSWRWGNFFDAAWVFFKVKPEAATEWQHVRLAADQVLSPTGYGQESGTQLEFVVPGGDDGYTGVFVRRAGDGLGLVDARRVTAIWDFGATPGVTRGNVGKAPIKAIGIEMVFIPEGAFFVGRGNGPIAPYLGKGYGGMEINWLYKHSGKPSDTAISLPFKFNIGDLYTWGVGVAREDPLPYRIESEAAIPTGKKKGALWAVDITPEDGGEISAAFPKGHAAFYCMKHAYPTAAQYAEFLNTLTAAQAKPRFYEQGHGMVIERSGVSPDFTYAAPKPDEKVPWMSFTDGAVFAAWSGLRPMTELEYEKCVRGPRPAIPNDSLPSCWGVQDAMALGIYERPVSIGSAVGRGFKGTHGRGAPELPADWPPDIRGAILRGDYFFGGSHQPAHLLTGGRAPAVYANADRHGANDAGGGGPSYAWTFAGWRAARTAPAGDTAVGPVTGELDLELKRPAKLATPFQLDGSLDEWADVTPVAVADSPAYFHPIHERFPGDFTATPWRGPRDFSAKAWLATDGEALLVAVEVTDDTHLNDQVGKDIYNGDALQIGLVNAAGTQWNVGAALAAKGVEFQQWDGPDETLLKSATYAVKRDDAAGVTRYEFRLPLADFGVVSGQECSFYFIFFDGDGALDWQGKPVVHRIQWVSERTEPFVRRNYPKFVIGD
ncbi:MAG: hypothetical protein FJ222_07425 [Lentisphaerae bacterium]|nr:hypothetical protein [Lentisphaerota bacterium]